MATSQREPFPDCFVSELERAAQKPDAPMATVMVHTLLDLINREDVLKDDIRPLTHGMRQVARGARHGLSRDIMNSARRLTRLRRRLST